MKRKKVKRLTVILAKIFTQWIRETSPHNVLLVAVLMGLLLIIASYMLTIHSVQIDLQENGYREVGYLAAVNWSLNFFIFFPFTLYYMLKSLQSLFIVLKSVTDQEMVRQAQRTYRTNTIIQWLRHQFVHQHWKIVTSDHLTKLWLNRFKRIVIRRFPIALAFAAFISIGEWIKTNFLPLMAPNYFKPSETAIDWGVAMLIRGETSTWLRVLNALFDLICFSMQALLIFSIVSYFLIMLEFSHFISQSSRDLKKENIFIIPNIRSDDKRRGFEVFDDLLQNMLLTGIFAYIMAYLSRLQNVYLNCKTETSLWNFVFNDIIRGLQFKGEMNPLSLRISCPNSLPQEPQNILMIASTFLVLLIIIFIIVLTIRDCASHGREILSQYIESGYAPREIGANSRQYIKDRIKNMDVWPMRYLKLNMLLLLCFFGIITLFFYRIGLLIFGVVIVVIVTKIISELKRSIN